MMVKNKYLLIGCLIALIVGLGTLSLNYIKTENQKNKEQQQSVLAATKNSYSLPEFDKDLFDKNIYKAKINPYPMQENIVAAIIPHHATAGFMIADLFQKAATQGIGKVIIIGPNHQELGGTSIITTSSNWLTPFGLVTTNEKLVNVMSHSNIARKDLSVFENEQSIYSLTPYIKFHLPNAEILPIILKKSTSLSEEKNLVEHLASITDEKTLVVASVDFSHYLDKKTANQKDDITLDLIKRQDISTLHTLTSDHLDSAPSVSIILQLVNKLEKNKIQVLDHKNSDDIYGTVSPSTTSYFYITFH